MTDNNDIIISTVVLNWNRSDLLKITISSYLNTVNVPYELIIVDNGSTDDSRKVLEELKNRFSNKINKIIFLDKNIGGEAINLGLSEAKGKLLHIGENDIEYLPGWSEKVVKLFSIFNELGQLSLFSPVPTDEEVWVPHPIKRILYKEGEIIYEALGNVGTTSIIRKEIWDKGVRIHNIKTNEFLFPDDVRLSEDILRLGYVVAWAPYYLVRNLGHSYNEILKRVEYYRENYESKKGLGYQGLLKRIDYYEKKVKPPRKSILHINSVIQPELSNIFKPIFTEEGKILDSQAWSCTDAITPEIENLELIYSLLRAFKPATCMVLSWAKDFTIDIIKQALENNNFGNLIILSDTVPSKSDESPITQIQKYEEIANINQPIDCFIFNSYLTDKLNISKQFLNKLSSRSLIVVTGNYEDIQKLVEIWNFLSKNFNCSFVSSARGLLICTSKIENQIKYYESKRIPKDLIQYIHKNRLFNGIVKIYFRIKNLIYNY
ncbi:hypothetical protein J5U23_01415 [Saccharolobus shibatae B12]|uniref:Glycosyltransferase 2-like domain-containing protein n=1 Tax=Saccharolobus shibatae (strain ATCC 51178 / DSM 5389 / JCM 8931 / NBRC 15437 / B12) TaxID=523848 RepID=A0A8F5GT91_SACSH|nr:glycosyltransferase family 2 protein [Saccharolobus shibatae]QXJ28546.1 hypothetical protein J5U23_01415 [Saccharolobus shibatae B12]